MVTTLRRSMVKNIPRSHPGKQTVTGVQATGYCRVRYTKGGDFTRAERQRTVSGYFCQGKNRVLLRWSLLWIKSFRRYTPAYRHRTSCHSWSTCLLWDWRSTGISVQIKLSPRTGRYILWLPNDTRIQCKETAQRTIWNRQLWAK